MVGPFLVPIGMCFFQHFFDYGPMIRPALLTSVLGGREGLVLAAPLALDHDALGTPRVDLAHLHVPNLVVSFAVLDYSHHQLPPSLSSFALKAPMAISIRSPLVTPFPTGYPYS